MVSTVLPGPWKAQATTDDLRRQSIEPLFDDCDWHDVHVPGHYAETQQLRNRRSVLYRTDFELAADDQQRHWLVFDGIWDSADVWLDGDYLGPTSGWFLSHDFDITDQIRKGTTHTLVVEVMSPRADPDQPTSRLNGIFDDPTVVGHTNPGGIWQPVRVVSTGNVRMHKNRAICTAATRDSATIHCRSHLLTTESQSVTIVTTVRPPGGGLPVETRKQHHLATGATVLEWDVHIDQPQLWWPWSRGDQPLYKVSVTVETGDSISGIWERIIGLRTVTMSNWKLAINGEPIFCKGADLWPTSALPASADPATIVGDIARAKALGLDLLRVESHVAHPAVYAEADRLGMLLWQDLPLRGEAKRRVRGQAVDAAHRLVDKLGSHASIVLWCAHYDPTGTTTGERATATLPTRRSLFGVARQQAPTWTKSVLDRLVGHAFSRADGSRPVVHGSGTWPSAPQFDGSDTHLKFGWNSGTGRDLSAFARRIPRMVRWVSSFGAQSVPHSSDVAVRDWPPDLGLLADKYGLSEAGFRDYVPATAHLNAADWVDGSQSYQAILLRRQIETLRRLKYKPTGGFTFAALADSRPAISFAIYDHDRVPKLAVDAVRAACAPAIVVADRLPAAIIPADPVLIDIHMINDGLDPIDEIVVTADLAWPGGSHRWAWTGSVGADDVARIGSVNWIAETTPGVVTLMIQARQNGVLIADNHYSGDITAI